MFLCLCGCLTDISNYIYIYIHRTELLIFSLKLTLPTVFFLSVNNSSIQFFRSKALVPLLVSHSISKPPENSVGWAYKMDTEFSHSHHLQCFYYVTISSHRGYNESLLTILSAFFFNPQQSVLKAETVFKNFTENFKHHLLGDANPDYPTSAPTLFPNLFFHDLALLFPFLQQLWFLNTQFIFPASPHH